VPVTAQKRSTVTPEMEKAFVGFGDARLRSFRVPVARRNKGEQDPL
jgi:hypothetical protein